MNVVILSHGLDTNGQNARYGKAAERWGTDESVTKALAIGNQDPGGVIGRLQIAAEKLGDLRIRSVHKSAAYFDFPLDITWTPKTTPLIAQLIEEADVIHLNNSDRPAMRFPSSRRKPNLLHHHGSLFRNNPEYMLKLARSWRMTQAVSTLDLTRPAEDVLHWLPTAYDIDWLEQFGKDNGREPDGRVRIVSCPTNREYKATDRLIAAVAELQAEGLPVDLVLVEGKVWTESLKAKAGADIVFDQLLWGYGCNGVEAWGLGKPVIAGADEWTTARMKREFGSLPFYEASEGTLLERIRSMVKSKALRDKWAAKGMAHVRKYHDERPALARLAELYVRTIATHSRVHRLDKPTRFRSTKGRQVYDTDGTPITFTDGAYSTTDPMVVQRLRYLATRPVFGIEEVA